GRFWSPALNKLRDQIEDERSKVAKGNIAVDRPPDETTKPVEDRPAVETKQPAKDQSPNGTTKPVVNSPVSKPKPTAPSQKEDKPTQNTDDKLIKFTAKDKNIEWAVCSSDENYIITSKPAGTTIWRISDNKKI